MARKPAKKAKKAIRKGGRASKLEPVKGFDWSQIKKKWKDLYQTSTKDSLKGNIFELLVLRCFALDGAEVKWPYRVKLQDKIVEEIDGAIYTKHGAFLLESKNKGTAQNIEPISKLRDKLSRRPLDTMGLVFSVSDFSDTATILANYAYPRNILLWRGEELDKAIEEEKMLEYLQIKKRYLIEYGVCDYNIKAEI